MDCLRVGIVGARFAAEFHLKAYRRSGRAEVVAVASRQDQTARAFARAHGVPNAYGDYRQMLDREDLDLVSICAPNSVHCEVALACASSGKHMVCEKPLTTSLEDARKMLAAAEAAGVRLMYAEDWVFAPALVRAMEIVNEGALGEVLYLKAKETHNGTHSPYAQKRATCGGGAMIHLGIHPIAWVCLAKAPHRVVEVTGVSSAGGEGNLVHKEYDAEDWAAATLTFDDGARALVEGNYITVGGLDDTVELYGTQGVLKVNLSQGSPVSVYSQVGYRYAIEKADVTTGWTRPAVEEEGSLGYYAEIAHFVDCVLHDREPARGARGEDGLNALAVCEAFYRSASTGRAITIEE